MRIFQQRMFDYQTEGDLSWSFWFHGIFSFFFLGGGCTINKDYIGALPTNIRQFWDLNQLERVYNMKHMAICNQRNMIFGCDLNWGMLS
jgi:hypothetical protein